MRIGTPNSRRRTFIRLIAVAALLALTFLIAGSTPFSRVGSNRATDASAPGEIITPAATALVDFTEMARVQALSSATAPPVRVLLWPETIEEPAEVPPPPGTTSSLGAISTPVEPLSVQVASPPPTQNYQGLDDIPMADSSYIVIPPDVSGAVGPTKVMESFNNNYRIRDKATGVTISTVGTATFWAAVTLPSERLSLTDPRLTYDPYNCRWIAAMQTVGLSGSVLVGVSLTSDPSGAWYLYKFTGLSGSLGTAYQLDYPMLGFNKNWVSVTINRYTSAGAFSYGICLALNYPLLQVGTGTGSLFTLNVGAASTHFCASPAVTYSPTEDSLFVITHLSSAGATYAVDVITGTSAAPVYNVSGVTSTRPGGGWTQPSGNQQPQSAPNAGASVCTPPCKIESSDAQVRADPIYRNGFLWYAQTIGLPSGGTLARTAAQWTRITPSTAPAFVDGGRIDDPTATATNGGKWHDHASLSVNANNDVMIGFTQFSSAQHPSAGYAMHLGGDGAGTTRDPLIYKAGDDYYHKTFTTATGRNRWGDFTTVIVDPCDDQTLWCLQEYAKTRTGIDDGNTGSNSSKWSTWWAAVGGPLRLAGATCPPDTIGAAGSAVGRWFRIFNNGSAADQFNYSITDVSGWGGPVSGTTPVLGPASFFDVFVSFNLPSACVPPSDLVTLTITPVGCAACFTPVVCTTTIYCDLATATLVGRFDAMAKAGAVDLVWESDAVGQIRGWNLYRSSTADAGFARINADVIPMAAGGEFHFTDDATLDGGAYYRLGAVMSDGAERVMQTLRYSASGTTRALEFRIAGNNPFRSSTMLHYSLPSRVPVRIDVYTITGQRAATLVNRTEDAGVHSVPFLLSDSGRKLGAGVYLVRLRAGNETRTLRAIALQ